MRATLFVTLPFTAHEVRTKRKARETVGSRQGRRSRPAGRLSNSGGVRAFRKLTPQLTLDARNQVCNGLGETEESLYDEAQTAVRFRDLRTLDSVVEELKFVSGARQTCRIR